MAEGKARSLSGRRYSRRRRRTDRVRALSVAGTGEATPAGQRAEVSHAVPPLQSAATGRSATFPAEVLTISGKYPGKLPAVAYPAAASPATAFRPGRGGDLWTSILRR